MFNAGQFMLSLAFGNVVGSLIDDLSRVSDGDPVTLRWLVAVIAACAAGFAANSVFISVAVAFSQGLPVREMLRRSLGINAGMDRLLLALAPVFVVIGLDALILVPLLLFTVFDLRSASIALRNKHEATHDELTGIANRRMFEDHAAMVVDASRADDLQFALVHIDLDGFKGVNDRLGHRYGDLVLIEIGRRLEAAERSTDQVARLGGDEFALLIADIDSDAKALAIAERVCAEITRPLEIEGVPLTVGASMGMALFPKHGDSIEELLHNADTAMYAAKRLGGGVQVFAGMKDDIGPKRVELLSELAVAIEKGQLSLAYQPKVDMVTGAVTTVEALLRWTHPVHGDVRPSWYMPQAEQTDLITPLTDHVIELALAQCRRWKNDGIDVGVAVNVSARNLHDLRLAARVADALERHQLPAAVLELEITENAVMEDPLRARTVLGDLRELGVSLAIDDFGTGYSSLSVLRDLDVDRIKIDRAFVTNVATCESDRSIVRSVVELGRNLGMKTIAEGVETVEALDVLRSIGCDEIQGFLFAAPLPSELLTPMLRQGRIEFSELPDARVTPS
ncbi:MAG: EAL domain-containing protein [Acidimicrobiales bacterium]